MDVQTQAKLAVRLAWVLSFLRSHLLMSKWLLNSLNVSSVA